MNLIKIGLVMLVLVAPAASAEVDILQTDAAASFKSGNYEQAVVEFAKLAAQNPDAPDILRYLAITLRKLERYSEALTVFKKVLALTPNSPSAHYHIGVTLYQAGAPDGAIKSFAQVLSLSPNSKYAELAQQYLDAITEQIANLQRPSEPKQFGVYAQLGAQHNSNLLAASDRSETGEVDGDRLNGYLSGQYFFVNKSGWLGTVDLSVYRSGYTEDEFSTLDLGQINPGISIQRTTKIGNYPAVNSVRYDYLDVELDGESYSESNVLTLASRIAFTQNTGTKFSYRYAADSFEQKGFDASFSSRDADNHSLGAVNTWYLRDRRLELDLGLDWVKSSADGGNFNSDSYSIKTAARFVLPWKLRFDLGLAYTDTEYPDFAGPILRETDALDFSLSLQRWFKNKFLVQINVAHHDEDSTYDALTYDRNTLGVNFSYAY
jgi:hypothetical protein